MMVAPTTQKCRWLMAASGLRVGIDRRFGYIGSDKIADRDHLETPDSVGIPARAAGVSRPVREPK